MLQDHKRVQKEDSMHTFLADLKFNKNHLYLVPDFKFKEAVLIACQSSTVVGHVGFFRTYYSIGVNSFGRGLNKM